MPKLPKNKKFAISMPYPKTEVKDEVDILNLGNW